MNSYFNSMFNFRKRRMQKCGAIFSTKYLEWFDHHSRGFHTIRGATGFKFLAVRLFRFNSKLLHAGATSCILYFRRVSTALSAKKIESLSMPNFSSSCIRLSSEMVSQDSCLSVVEDMEEKLTLEILSISSLQTIVNIVLSSYKCVLYLRNQGNEDII